MAIEKRLPGTKNHKNHKNLAWGQRGMRSVFCVYRVHRVHGLLTSVSPRLCGVDFGPEARGS